MTNLAIIIITSAIAFIGILDLLKTFYNNKKMLGFAKEYLKTFKIFSNAYLKNNFDSELYEWLTYHSVKIQFQIGSYGIIAYRPPYENYIVHNYQIIINSLPEFRTSKIHKDNIYIIDAILIRYIGITEDMINSFRKNLFNPFVWLRIGMQNILTIPFQMFYWFGILNYSSILKIKDNILIKIISTLIIIIGLISSIVTITLGWTQFIKIWQSIIN